ncbi:alpha/beta fold hydrolase [Solimonas marina]|uniref:Xaa-Pro dipeptidyl-peptidase-like domain-containing protein n=1 Tax=Solimonas marina TaxID=2714601 RepID=A0A970B6J5_9GAMM|nr:alpha/beta fold hydrolase [Solimonas marina]NKF22670.1 hypothetical protein [Solimonas marina]
MDVRRAAGWMRVWGVLGLVGFLSACGTSATPKTTAYSQTIPKCASPLPPEAQQFTLTDDIPQDFDATVDPAPQTTIAFTVMLPERCADNRFPIVLQSHGFGGARQTALAADGTLYPQHAGLDSIDELTTALPYHGYIVISFDERGHGESQPKDGGGYTRLIDPAAETQDARAILDWAYDHASEIQAQTQDDTGIAKDVRVGTLGYSYGGAFQWPLAALDPRVDAIVPIASWHNLLYSVAPGHVMKQSWAQILCLFATIPSDLAVVGSINTPLVDTMCNQIAIRNPFAFTMRTLDDLLDATSRDTARPRPISADEFMTFFGTHGLNYFRNQQAAGEPWGFGEKQAKLRPVPALILQGNRDNLFNMTDGYWNWRYLRDAGGDVRFMTMESGHLNPLAGQIEGTMNCGTVKGVNAIVAWFDEKLKGHDTLDYDTLPQVCISVADTVGAPDVPAAAVELDDVPVGSQSGDGAVPATLDSLDVTVPATAAQPQFVPVLTVQGDDKVIAGIPLIRSLTVTPGAGAVHDAIALVGVGIRRNGQTLLVDQQLTPFQQGAYTANDDINEGDPILLPGVGERLRDGDELGLLFYEQSPQYAVVVSADGLANLPEGAVSLLFGKPLPIPIASILEPPFDVLTNPNPYSVTASGIELPVIVPGTYPHSTYTQGEGSDAPVQ